MAVHRRGIGNWCLNLSMLDIIVIALLGQLCLRPVNGAFMTSSFIGDFSSGGIAGLPRSLELKHQSSTARSHVQNQRQIHHLYSTPRNDETHPDTPLMLPSLNRRQVLQSTAYLSLSQPLLHPTNAQASEQPPLPRGTVFEIEDPNTYSAVVYIPPAKESQKQGVESFPVLVVLHGAGNDEHSALYEFTEPGSSSTSPGDHTNLPPYLLSTQQAPTSLSENFIVVAPYAGKGKRSLYDEPRGKILSFVKWFNSYIETQTNNNIAIDRRRVSLFGFSEGSTLAVELATTRQFNGVVICSYGFTGILPKMAVERLNGIPMWVFHSKGDDIYDMKCSNQLVDSLIEYAGSDVFSVRDIIKYTKLVPQQTSGGDGSTISGREHVRAALVASKSGEVYSWLLALQ